MEGLDATGSAGLRVASVFLQGAKRPRISKRKSVDGCSILGPSRNQDILKDIPKNENIQF